MRTAVTTAGALLFLCLCCQAKVVLVSLDGFRYDYIEMAKAKGRNVSAFEEIARDGFRAEVQNVFITITFPTHYSIATGRYVENHGLYNNQYRDPKFKESFSYKNATQQMDPKWLEYNNNEPIWLTNQRHGSRSCVFYWPGSNQPYKGKYPFATSGLYSDHPTFQYRVDRLMDWMTQDEFTFCALYFNEPDHSGHAHGPNSTEVLKAIELVNDGIAYLLQKIKSHPKLNGKVDLIVTADHGMTYIPEANRINLYEAVNSSRYRGNISPPVVGMWPGETPFGMHGYDNSFREMHPFLVASGPGIRKTSGIQEFHQVDIYPLICSLLGLQRPNVIDGRIDRVLPFMNNPPSKEFVQTFKKYANGIISNL
ncbi:hypothetical protein AAHC03_023003 [Spirometra sp. Aus1]